MPLIVYLDILFGYELDDIEQKHAEMSCDLTN